MARRDVVQAIEWVLRWDRYTTELMRRAYSRKNERRIVAAHARLQRAIKRLREIWCSSGHFWMDEALKNSP